MGSVSIEMYMGLILVFKQIFSAPEAVSELAVSLKSSSMIILILGWGACCRGEKGRLWHLLPVKSIN